MNRKIIILQLLLILSLSSLFGSISGINFPLISITEDVFKSKTNYESELNLTSTNYTERTPILLTSDDDFQNQNFTGSGSEYDPFIIEGYNITSNGEYKLIQIQNTEVYFEIRNNYLSNGLNGIYFSNVKNGRIFNNILYKCTQNTIYLSSSTNNTFLSNFIINNTGNGILLLINSDYNTISSNFIDSNGGHGLVLYSNNNIFASSID